MHTLSELLDRWQLPVGHPERPVIQKDWEACKRHVDSMPANFGNVILNNQHKARVTLSGNSQRTSVMGRYSGFEVELIVYEPKKKNGETHASYFAYNTDTNEVYQRDLQDLEQAKKTVEAAADWN